MNKRLFISGLLAIVLSCNNAIFADIFSAAVKGNLREVKEIVKKNPDAVNEMNYIRRTPLFFAVKGGNLDVVRYLVQMRAKVNHMDDNEITPLVLAVILGKLPIVKYLIGEGADPNLGDLYRRTPLFFAAYKGYLDIVKYLIQNGANPNHTDRSGKTAASFAISRENTVVVGYLQRIQNFSQLSKENKIQFIRDNINQGWIKDILSFAFATSMLEFYKPPQAGLSNTFFGQLFKQAKKNPKLMNAIKKTFGIMILPSYGLYRVVTKILKKIDIAITKTTKFRKLLEKERMKEQRIRDLLERARYILELEE